MPPLPTLWDPAGAVDKLPQPFRMIDKILADIVEQVVDLIGKREQQRKLEEAARVNLTFAPHAVMEVPPQTTTFLPVGVAGIAAVALPDGELRVHSARDAGTSCSDRTHASQVTALEAGMVVSTSGRLLAAASRGTLTIHEVDVKTCGMVLLLQVPLPQDPDDPSPPVRLHWAPTLCHLAVCYGSGALVLYGLSLPVPNVSLDGASAFVALNLAAFGETSAREVLRVPAATVRAFCMGSADVGESHVVWQTQQRPDKTPHSDRYHKTARGAYVWWEGANRLLLLDLAAAAAAAPPAPPQPSGTQRSKLDQPPGTAQSLGPSGQPPESEASNASALTTASAKALKRVNSKIATAAAAAAVAGGLPEPTAPPRVPQVAPMARDWLLPHNITASAATADGKTLAWGLVDGSVVLWDDRCCCATKVLPRLRGRITALGWVNGVAHKLMCASEAGDIFIADTLKPEDSSAKPYEFPQPIHEIHFLPYEPFALCICRGHTSSSGELPGPPGAAAAVSGGDALATPARRPRFIWYNVLEEKPVAELMGPQEGQGFGLVCCVPPPPVVTAPAAEPPPDAPKLPAASAGAKAALISALNAMGANVSLGPTLVPVRLEVPPGSMPAFPAFAFRDTYLVVGGEVVDKVVHSRFAEDADAVPQRVAQLYMYKVDALLRHLLPEDEAMSRLGKVVLDRLLADLEAPKAKGRRKGKRVTLDIDDPDAPKLPSSMRKPDPFDAAAGGGSRSSSRAANRHITFGSLDELFNDNLDGKKYPKETKVFPKETKKGLKTAPSPVPSVETRRGPDGKPRLAPLGLEKAKEAPPPFAERSQSPPWHHTNPLARIHPDWEEAPVLIRIMERIGSKGGGRKRREKRLEQVTGELMTKYAKEAGARPNLFVDLSGPKVDLGSSRGG